jgi:hypothetical protein
MQTNGHTIYQSDLCQVRRSNYASFTLIGNTLYMHVHFWPGEYVAIFGLRTKVKSAKLMKTGEPLKFTQDDFRARVLDLPMKAPDFPIMSAKTSRGLACKPSTCLRCKFEKRSSQRRQWLIHPASMARARASLSLCSITRRWFYGRAGVCIRAVKKRCRSREFQHSRLQHSQVRSERRRHYTRHNRIAGGH